MYIAKPLVAPPTQSPKELRFGSESNTRLDGGLSLKYDPSQINDNQSPYMLNECADDKGELTKRPGQSNVYTSSLGSGKINGLYDRLFSGFKVFAWGTDLYKQTGSSAPVSIMTGLANAKGIFFTFGINLYYLNGTNFVYWDGITVSASLIVPYIPTLTLGRSPAGGGGTLNEDFNLIGAGFKDSFSGTSAGTVYQMSIPSLDATPPMTAVVNGAVQTEGVGFTVNRTTGAVTFAVSPGDVTTNNVLITGYKTVTSGINRILNCTVAIAYGGENDTRAFLSGNPSFNRRLFRSAVNDLSYFPDLAFQDVGASDSITQLAKHFDRLIIFKQRSIYSSYYNNIAQQGFYGADGFTVNFPTSPLNSSIGCDMPNSVQIIDNNVVFGNSDLGVFILISTNLKDENVVRLLSDNINGNSLRPGLLDISKASLQAASSVDFDGKYYLCVGNTAYVWDYRLSPYLNSGNVATDAERLSWFPYDTINAACWSQDSRTLYYGDRTNGKLVQFNPTLYNDFGSPINAYWRSKNFSFGLFDYLKTIPELWFTTRTAAYSLITVKYLDENGTIIDTTQVVSSSWSWASFAWNQFSWAVSQFPPTIRKKPKVKKVIYFSVEFSNNLLNQNLSILSLVIRYLIARKVK